MSGRLQCRGVADRLRLIITVEAKEWHRNFWFPYGVAKRGTRFCDCFFVHMIPGIQDGWMQ